jgi:hypothetical protein
MTGTTTYTTSESFTLTNAKYLCSKVTADMLRCLQAYGRPSEQNINDYGTELAYLLRDGYVEEYEFGFRRDDERLVSWRYKVVHGSLNSTDDRPGKLLTGVDVATASHFNFLTYSSAWARLSQQDRERIEGSLPIKRTTGQPPKDGLGYWVEDRSYASAGVSMSRRTFHLYSTV